MNELYYIRLLLQELGKWHIGAHSELSDRNTAFVVWAPMFGAPPLRSDRVTGAMTACVCVEGDSIAELQDHMNTTGHSEHRNPEQMARTTEPLGVPYKDALKADKLGREVPCCLRESIS